MDYPDGLQSYGAIKTDSWIWTSPGSKTYGIVIYQNQVSIKGTLWLGKIFLLVSNIWGGIYYTGDCWNDYANEV